MISRRHLFAALPAIGFAATRAGAAPSKLVRVGFQKGEPILLAAKQNHSLETLLNPLGIDVQWVEFQFGPPMLEAMRVNAIDIGAVGDTPPVFAQAAHGDLLYIAAQRAGGQAILVPPGSTFQTLQDLKGKKVAFGRGSSCAQPDDRRAGEGRADLRRHPADLSRPRRCRSGVRAWRHRRLDDLGPVLRAVRDAARRARAGEVDRHRRAELVLHGPPRLCRGQRTQVTAKLVAEFDAHRRMGTRSHRPELAASLATATGMPLDAVQRAVDRAPFQVLPMNDELAASQQKVADRFRALGLIPTDIKVGEEVWRAGA